jgi:hypothetical protein
LEQTLQRVAETKIEAICERATIEASNKDFSTLEVAEMLQNAAQDVDPKAEEVIKKFFGTLRPGISATGNAMYKIGQKAEVEVKDNKDSLAKYNNGKQATHHE